MNWFKIFFVSILLLTFLLTSGQNVNIPDENFKNGLIELGVDTNGDGEISYEEAEAYHGSLELDSEGISDLTGIKAFINAYDINVNNNNIKMLDVSGLYNLKYFHCENNDLVSLDLSGCNYLKNINCNSNFITSVLLLECWYLDTLFCNNNLLTELDIIYLANLKLVDISFNSNFNKFCIRNFPVEFEIIDEGTPEYKIMICENIPSDIFTAGQIVKTFNFNPNWNCNAFGYFDINEDGINDINFWSELEYWDKADFFHTWFVCPLNGSLISSTGYGNQVKGFYLNDTIYPENYIWKSDTLWYCSGQGDDYFGLFSWWWLLNDGYFAVNIQNVEDIYSCVKLQFNPNTWYGSVDLISSTCWAPCL